MEDSIGLYSKTKEKNQPTDSICHDNSSSEEKEKREEKEEREKREARETEKKITK